VIEARLLSVWDGLVGSAAFIAIIILALCVMVGAVKREDILRHLGVIVGNVILLIMLPAVILGLWNAMSFRQHLGIVALVLMIAFLFGVLRKERRRRSGRARRGD
jgi:hypothetical protein